MNQNTERARLFFLDSARGLAILLVVLGHIWETEELIPVLIYSFHVPLFFIISGILINYTDAQKKSWKTLILSRITGLLLPYILYELIFVIIFGLRSGFDFSSLGTNAWDGLLLKPQNVPLWFLICLFFSELVLILFLKTFSDPRITAFLSLILYLLPFLIAPANYATELFLKTCSSLGFLALGYFCASFVRNTSMPAWLLVVLLFAGGGASWLNGKTGINKLTFHNPVLFTFSAVVLSFCILFLLKKTRIRVLEFAGKNTLPVLGLHIIVLRILEQILGLDTSSVPGMMAALVLIFLLLTPVCLFINRFLPPLAGRPYSSK